MFKILLDYFYADNLSVDKTDGSQNCNVIFQQYFSLKGRGKKRKAQVNIT